jgi:hypothetical protein
MVSRDEHIIVCNICRRALIVKDIINNGLAFLSHLKLDHGITYTPQLRKDKEQKMWNGKCMRRCEQVTSIPISFQITCYFYLVYVEIILSHFKIV